MNERLFQFIWQQLRFNQRNLQTLYGEKLIIIHPGELNTNQGPDFLNARVRINATTWAGNIELHLKETDWKRHGHSLDPNYENVILHVVFQADGDEGCRTIPTLSLEGRIPHALLNRHEHLVSTSEDLPCRNLLLDIPAEKFTACNEKMVQEKWDRKRSKVSEGLQECKFHFEEVLWRMVAGNFGSPVNSGAFETIARSIPWKVVQQIRYKPHALEAVLLGQGGLLSKKFREKYPAMLKKEFEFLSAKYKLTKPQVALHFLRMRPANFPTIRLVQLADLMIKNNHLFATLRDAKDASALKQLLDVCAGDFWDYHYRPDEEAAFKKKNLGDEMKNNILVNTFLPFLYAYGRHVQSQETMEKAMAWLKQIPPENNRLVRQFDGTGFRCENAFDSQALVFLKKEYCNEKKCLSCSIGITLLK